MYGDPNKWKNMKINTTAWLDLTKSQHKKQKFVVDHVIMIFNLKGYSNVRGNLG